jgi:hypothetical protein
MLNAIALDFLFRSKSKGMISFPAIGTREQESFDAIGERRL